MSLTATASKRFSRALSAPVYALQALNTIGETCGKTSQSNNSDFCVQDFRRRPFATESTSQAKNSDTSTINENQDQESTLSDRTNKNIFQRMHQKYSMSLQTNRILLAESLFQAATVQASDL